jgi:hypothetical protein
MYVAFEGERHCMVFYGLHVLRLPLLSDAKEVVDFPHRLHVQRESDSHGPRRMHQEEHELAELSSRAGGSAIVVSY